MTLELSTFKEKWGFLAHRKIFIGLSGGVDSVVLLRLLVLCGFDVEAIHVNYQLRGEDSEGDELFVRSLCKELRVPLYVKKVDTRAILSNQGGNLQAVARNIRYDFFQSFIEKHESGIIAIAHHQDDQIETFFLNLARKSGIRGLACMLEIDNEKIRPLLQFSKQEIIRFAKLNHWDWREDLSNQSLKYKRNALRNKFIPEMLQHVSNLDKAVITLVNTFQTELKNIQSSIFHLVEKTKSTGCLALKDFNLLSQNQQVEFLFMLGLNASEIKSFYKLFEVQKGKYIETRNCLRVFKEKDGFSFERFFPKIDIKFSITKINKLPISFSKNELFFDLDLVEGEISMRPWQKSDRISPIGMKGSKLISDVLNDAKLKAIERLQWPVLVDVDGILACPLISVAKKKIANQNSTNIICVHVQRVIC